MVGGGGVTPQHVILNVDTDDKLFGSPTNVIRSHLNAKHAEFLSETVSLSYEIKCGYYF